VRRVGGPLGLVNRIKKQFKKNSRGYDLENREYGIGIRHADYATLDTGPEDPLDASFSKRSVSYRWKVGD
jgi:hypothetical protein